MCELARSAPASPVRAKQPFREGNLHDANLEGRRRMFSILQDMVSNSERPPCRRRYTVATLAFAFLIATTSFTCYNLLRRFLFLPSYCVVWKYFRDDLRQFESYVTDINKLPSYLEHLTETLGQEKELIAESGGFLAVDAMSLRPHVYVTKDGFVEGVLDHETVSDEILAPIKERWEAYERYLASIKNKTITDSFVYQYQPIAANARCFTVFIEPSTQGKATGTQIDRLSDLARLLEEHGFPVEGFSFDGDTTYSKLHATFFDNYNRVVTQDTSFENFSVLTGLSIVSDPLHLIKRARYRILSSKIHGGFENTTESVISVDSLRSQLDLPSAVWSNEKYTKMHDDIAVRLFSLETLASLFEKRNMTALTYFLPICLLCASLEEPNLRVEEKCNLLVLGLYYMLAYYAMLSESPSQLRQKKTRTSIHLCPFDGVFVREYCNTVCSILKVLYKVNGTIGLNRVGSNPVEHLFGLIRMKSHSVHTFDKMILIMSKAILQQKFIKEIGENQRIDKRLTNFAKDVINNPWSAKNGLNMHPRDLAFTFHCIFGFPVNVRDLMVWDATSLFEIRDEIFEKFRSQVLSLSARCRGSLRRRLTSTEVKLTKGSQITGRLSDRNVIS